MSKPFLVLHPSMKAEVERIQALETYDNPDEADAQAILNSVDVHYQGEIGRVDSFQINKDPKRNLFKYPPDATIRKLMRGWKF